MGPEVGPDKAAYYYSCAEKKVNSIIQWGSVLILVSGMEILGSPQSSNLEHMHNVIH